MIQQAATQFGVSPPTRTRSRRHSHWPMARQHCEFYFAYKVLNWSMRRLAKTSGRSVSTVHAGIHKGRKLVHDAADRQGYVDDAGIRFRHDRQETHGCRPDVEADPWALD